MKQALSERQKFARLRHRSRLLIEADVTDPQAVDRAFYGVHGCFHLAAIASVGRSHREWLRTHQVTMTLDVLGRRPRMKAPAVARDSYDPATPPLRTLTHF